MDGAEGGTGSAPLEFSDHLGSPLTEGLITVHNALVGAGLRDRIKIGASGKVATTPSSGARYTLTPCRRSEGQEQLASRFQEDARTR